MKAVSTVGSARERGSQLGEALRADIQQFIADGFAHTAGLNPVSELHENLDVIIQPYADSVRRWLPEIAEEIEGLAAGASITNAEAWLLQYRRELTTPRAYGCSSIGQTGEDAFVAQTIDLAGNMSTAFHLASSHPDKGPKTISASFVGLLGYLGMNENGLAVAINMVVSDDWQVGVSPYLLVKAILACDNMDEAMVLLNRVPRSSSRCITLVDKHKAIAVEMTATEASQTESERALHTNHYLHADIKRHDKIDPATRMESRKRLAKLRKVCAEETLSATTAIKLLSTDDFVKSYAQSASNVETVAVVSLDIDNGRMTAYQPGINQPVEYDFDGTQRPAHAI